MSEQEQITTAFKYIYKILCFITAMIGYTIHNSLFWSIIDFIFMPYVWCKWIVCHEVNISIIKKTFEFFLK
jgi:hypothetical protein